MYASTRDIYSNLSSQMPVSGPVVITQGETSFLPAPGKLYYKVVEESVRILTGMTALEIMRASGIKSSTYAQIAKDKLLASLGWEYKNQHPYSEILPGVYSIDDDRILVVGNIARTTYKRNKIGALRRSLPIGSMGAFILRGDALVHSVDCGYYPFKIREISNGEYNKRRRLIIVVPLSYQNKLHLRDIFNCFTPQSFEYEGSNAQRLLHFYNRITFLICGYKQQIAVIDGKSYNELIGNMPEDIFDAVTSQDQTSKYTLAMRLAAELASDTHGATDIALIATGGTIRLSDCEINKELDSLTKASSTVMILYDEYYNKEPRYSSWDYNEHIVYRHVGHSGWLSNLLLAMRRNHGGYIGTHIIPPKLYYISRFPTDTRIYEWLSIADIAPENVAVESPAVLKKGPYFFSMIDDGTGFSLVTSVTRPDSRYYLPLKSTRRTMLKYGEHVIVFNRPAKSFATEWSV